MVLHPSREAQHLHVSPNISVIHPSSFQVFKIEPISMDFTHWHQGFDTLQLWTMLSSIVICCLPLLRWVFHWTKLLSTPRSVGVEPYYPDSVYEVRIDHKHSKFILCYYQTYEDGIPMSSGEPDLESLTVAFFEGMPGTYIICKGIQEIP